MHNLTLYHASPSRSSIVLWMLEELGQPHDLKLLSLKQGDKLKPNYLSVNPIGKVPALKHGDTVITEAAAICAYLADEFPLAKLNIPVGSTPRRGVYLKWLFFGPSCIEPAVIDRTAPRKEEARRTMLGYGPYTTAYNRFNRWSRRGICKRVFDQLASKSRDSLYLIDSTVVKAHRAASGAKGGEKSGDRRQPGRSDHKNPRDRRQQSSATQLHGDRRTNPRQPSRRRHTPRSPLAITADKAYDSAKVRQQIKEEGALPIIPNRCTALKKAYCPNAFTSGGTKSKTSSAGSKIGVQTLDLLICRFG